MAKRVEGNTLMRRHTQRLCPPRALFNGLERQCGAPFVRKRALLLFVGALSPFSSLRSSMHPENPLSRIP